MNGIIKVTGYHDRGDSSPEIIKEEADASLSCSDDKYTITYTSAYEQDKETIHTIEIKNGTLCIIQTGSVNSKMYFSPGGSYDTDYKTPYGVMKMKVVTNSLFTEIKPKKITAHVQYELHMDGQKVSTSKTRISFIKESTSSL